MSQLTKAAAKLHAEACDLLAKDVLTEDDRWFVLEHWQASAQHVNSTAGAFFTPVDLATSFAIEVAGPRIIDLCAGIGTLSLAALRHIDPFRRGGVEIVCVERNPAYVEVGRKVLPEATWICADIFDLPRGLGQFDTAISNPPFGATKKSGKAPRFGGKHFEYHVIDIASGLARYGAFIIPQNSAPFRLSGKPFYSEGRTDQYEAFERATGITLECGCAHDTSFCRDDWHGVAPQVEIVIADFEAARATRLSAGAPLFSALAA